MGKRAVSFEELKEQMRDRKPRNVLKRKRAVDKQTKRTNYRKVKALRVNHEYYAKRVEDFLYYVERSDLNIAQISKGLNIPIDWLYSVVYGRIKRPSEHRVTTIIDFIKDFERLQTYYTAVIK